MGFIVKTGIIWEVLLGIETGSGPVAPQLAP